MRIEYDKGSILELRMSDGTYTYALCLGKVVKDKSKVYDDLDYYGKNFKLDVLFGSTKDVITNEVVLIGYICKKPIYRQTPFGREIADILLAVNRAYNKSDYIPTIAWGRTARFCQNLEVGTKVKIVGRVQSRMYEKKHEDGTTESRVAYEVSVGSLEVVEEKEGTENKETENQEAV